MGGMLVVGRDQVGDMGSVGSVLRDVGKGALTVAKTAAAGAVAGAGQSVTDKLRNWLSPGGGAPKRPGQPAATNYLPWILGGAAVVGVVVLAGRRH